MTHSTPTDRINLFVAERALWVRTVHEALSYLVHDTDIFADEAIRVVVTSQRAGIEIIHNSAYLGLAGIEREGDLFTLPLDEAFAILDEGGEDAAQRLVEQLMGW